MHVFINRSRATLRRILPISSREQNRLELTRAKFRKATLPTVLPAKSGHFSSTGELSGRCRIAAKACLARALGISVDPGWADDMNKLAPEVVADDDDDDDGDYIELDDDESDDCLDACDALFAGAAFEESLAEAARSQGRTKVKARLIVYRWREMVLVELAMTFVRGTVVASCRGVRCLATSVRISRRSRHVEDGPSYKNLKNHCCRKTDMPREEYITDYEDEDDSDDHDRGGCDMHESDDDDDEECFVPKARSIFDMAEELGEAETKAVDGERKDAKESDKSADDEDSDSDDGSGFGLFD